MRLRRMSATAACALLAGCGSTVTGAQLGAAQGASGALGGALAGTVGTATTATNSATSGTLTSDTTTGQGTTTAGASTGSATDTSTGTGYTDSSGTYFPPTTTASKQPLSIGIVTTDGAAAAAAVGYSFGNTITERQIDDGLIAALNAKGGLAGRKIVPVYASTSLTTPNWETDFTAACAKLTQDNHVAAVLGYVFNYYASFESCLAKKKVVHLSTSFNIPDEAELRPYPLFYALDVATIGRRSLAKIDGAVATGLMSTKNRLGMLTDDCPGTTRSLNATAIPALKRRGLQLTKTVTLSCVNGYADSSSASAAAQSAVLSFASAKVDRVLFHSVSEGPTLAQFMIAAEQQGYRPDYVVSSLANLAVSNGYTPKPQNKNVYGFGWMPIEDVLPAYYGKPNAPQQRCLDLLKSRGLKPTAAADFGAAYQICDAFFTYEAALLKTNGDSTGEAVIAALHTFGTKLTSVVNLDGRAFFAAGRFDAVQAARPLIYFPACDCWKYVGVTRTIPSN